ncbi:MAG TPA: hypothetical protein VEK73_11290 [Xanthobacteraceae bacterium]|nr:hypothetical protein [Xanthobacteraceae bacterium]
MAELERGRLRGDEVPAVGLILQELRSATPSARFLPPRLGDPQRLFFAPLEPFLIDDPSGRKRPGRIPRASLEPIWRWLSVDLLPAEAAAYADEASRHLLAAEAAEAEPLAHALHDLAVEPIEAALSAVDADLKARHRILGRIGTRTALEDLRDVACVLKGRDALAKLGARLPPHIRNLADEQLENVKALFDAPAARQRDVFLYGLVLVMSRLGSPWHLIRLAVRMAETDKAARIADTPAALAVAVVLDDIELQVTQLHEEIKGEDLERVVGLLKDIHDGARGLRTELDLTGDHPWGRRLAAVRGEVSALIERHIAAAPGRVHRLLRPRGADALDALDPREVAEVEGLIDLVNACRNYASELAINEATQRVHSQLQNYLDTGMAPLLDGLRQAGAGQRKFRQSQVEAAVRFAHKMFGAEYAAVLVKAAEVAAQDADPKAAKA